MSDNKIIWTDRFDEGLRQAARLARASFKYFWRELSWEYRRIIPGLDFSAVKVAFPVENGGGGGRPEMEFMWISEIEFDGHTIAGILMNEPQWVSSISEGDPVSIPREELVDWIYALDGRVFGAFTVQAMRATMGAEELAGHDEAWGLDFGDPQAGLVAFASEEAADGTWQWSEQAGLTAKELEGMEHPMALNSGASFAEALSKDPTMVSATDEKGWTMLHQEALAGNLGPVEILLEQGADVSARNSRGETALDLARHMGWRQVMAALQGG